MFKAGTNPVVLVLGQAGAISGGDVHAFRLAEAWSRSDGSVQLFGSPDVSRFLADDWNGEVVALTTPFDRRMRSSPYALAMGVLWRGLKAIPRLRSAGIVVTASHLIFDVAPAAVARLLFGTPVAVYVYHVIADMERPKSFKSSLTVTLEAMSLWLVRRSKANVFYDNPEAHASLVRLGFPEQRLHPTTNAYDPNTAVLDRAKPACGPLLFVGRLVPQKGVLDVLSLARRLKALDSDAAIDIVGDGPLREQVAKTIEDERLDNVNVLGFVDEAVKWQLLSRTSLFLAPSREEGWGIAVGEALLAGAPVVAMDLPAYDHFTVRFDRASSGDDFVERAVSIATDPAKSEAMADAVAAERHTLPRWSDIITGDLVILERSRRSAPRGGVR